MHSSVFLKLCIPRTQGSVIAFCDCLEYLPGLSWLLNMSSQVTVLSCLHLSYKGFQILHLNKNINLAKSRCKLINWHIVYECSSIQTFFDLCRYFCYFYKPLSQPSECGRQHTLNSVHAQIANRQQSNGNSEARMSEKCEKWIDQFIMTLSSIHWVPVQDKGSKILCGSTSD